MGLAQPVDAQPVAEDVDDRQAAKQPALEVKVGDIHSHILPGGWASLPTVLATYTLKAQKPSILNVRSPMSAQSPPEVDAERRRILDELGQLGFTLPGSIATRTVTCGRATCRCATDPAQRHGALHPVVTHRQGLHRVQDAHT